MWRSLAGELVVGQGCDFRQVARHVEADIQEGVERLQRPDRERPVGYVLGVSVKMVFDDLFVGCQTGGGIAAGAHRHEVGGDVASPYAVDVNYAE